MASPQINASKSPAGQAHFGPTASPPSKAPAANYQALYPSSSPNAERRSFDQFNQAEPIDGAGADHLYPTVALYRLPPSMNNEGLRSMLLFAEDLISASFINSQDSGFQSAVARFRTIDGAMEVKRRLHGKPNSGGGAKMVAELVQSAGLPPTDGSSSLHRTLSDAKPPHHASLTRGLSLNSHSGRPQSRYFQPMGDKLHSHPSNSQDREPGRGEHPFEGQSLFSGSPPSQEWNRATGKSIINDDADDETGELIRDPVAYARNGHAGGLKRNNSSSQPPLARFSNLTLNTGNGPMGSNHMMTSPNSGYGNSRAPQLLGSPIAEMSPNSMSNGIPPMSPTGGYPAGANLLNRHHFPPANPADQNPPCNTLYVGNLPIDTSEDELKAVFCKQRGYKRLCFRTKHNGPMCFVEFEDVSFATKALNELYGHLLSNSVKGGIRLSFSKNPLGVRTGQTNAGNPMTPLSPNGGLGMGNMPGPPGFSTVSGPPPGLSAPPGLRSPNASNNAGGQGPFQNGFGSYFSGANSPPSTGHLSSQGPRMPLSGFVSDSPFSQQGSSYDFMMGR